MLVCLKGKSLNFLKLFFIGLHYELFPYLSKPLQPKYVSYHSRPAENCVIFDQENNHTPYNLVGAKFQKL